MEKKQQPGYCYYYRCNLTDERRVTDIQKHTKSCTNKYQEGEIKLKKENYCVC